MSLRLMPHIIARTNNHLFRKKMNHCFICFIIYSPSSWSIRSIFAANSLHAWFVLKSTFFFRLSDRNNQTTRIQTSKVEIPTTGTGIYETLHFRNTRHNTAVGTEKAKQIKAKGHGPWWLVIQQLDDQIQKQTEKTHWPIWKAATNYSDLRPYTHSSYTHMYTAAVVVV